MTGTTNKRIAHLKLLRRILIVIALLLSIVAATSGFFVFQQWNHVEEESNEPSVTEESCTPPVEEAKLPSTQTEETHAAETSGEETNPSEMHPEESYPEESYPEDFYPDESQPEESNIENPDSKVPGFEDPHSGKSDNQETEPEVPYTDERSQEVLVLADTEMQQVDLTESASKPSAQENPVPDASENPICTETAPSDIQQETAATEEGISEPTETTCEETTVATTKAEDFELYQANNNNLEPPEPPKKFWWITALFLGSAFLLAVDLVIICIVSAKIHKLSASIQKASTNYGVTEDKTFQASRACTLPTVGRIHKIGMRNYQQDSFGQIPILNDQGLLAVVADGMGGLSDGEKVSQRIVIKALDFAARITHTPNADTLMHMVNLINNDVNQMLGRDNLFKSGSTLVATLVMKDSLWWVSVGDSRIYLYRNGYLNQLTRDHDLLQEWMDEVSQGKMTYSQAVSNPDGRKLTSFIGMGKLRHIDHNSTPIPLYPGDRILLMSDGVYGTVSTDEMIQILNTYPDVQHAADAVSRQIENANQRHQDNYTIMILGL